MKNRNFLLSLITLLILTVNIRKSYFQELLNSSPLERNKLKKISKLTTNKLVLFDKFIIKNNNLSFRLKFNYGNYTFQNLFSDTYTAKPSINLIVFDSETFPVNSLKYYNKVTCSNNNIPVVRKGKASKNYLTNYFSLQETNDINEKNSDALSDFVYLQFSKEVVAKKDNESFIINYNSNKDNSDAYNNTYNSTTSGVSYSFNKNMKIKKIRFLYFGILMCHKTHYSRLYYNTADFNVYRNNKININNAESDDSSNNKNKNFLDYNEETQLTLQFYKIIIISFVAMYVVYKYLKYEYFRKFYSKLFLLIIVVSFLNEFLEYYIYNNYLKTLISNNSGNNNINDNNREDSSINKTSSSSILLLISKILFLIISSIQFSLIFYTIKLISRSYHLLNIFEDVDLKKAYEESELNNSLSINNIPTLPASRKRSNKPTNVSNNSPPSKKPKTYEAYITEKIDRINSEYYNYNYIFPTQSLEFHIFLIHLFTSVLLTYYFKNFQSLFNISFVNDMLFYSLEEKFNLSSSYYIYVFLCASVIFVSGISVWLLYVFKEDFDISLSKSMFDLSKIKGNQASYIAMCTFDCLYKAKFTFFSTYTFFIIYYVIQLLMIFVNINSSFYSFFIIYINSCFSFFILLWCLIGLYCSVFQRKEVVVSKIISKSKKKIKYSSVYDNGKSNNNVKERNKKERNPNSNDSIENIDKEIFDDSLDSYDSFKRDNNFEEKTNSDYTAENNKDNRIEYMQYAKSSKASSSISGLKDIKKNYNEKNNFTINTNTDISNCDVNSDVFFTNNNTKNNNKINNSNHISIMDYSRNKKSYNVNKTIKSHKANKAGVYSNMNNNRNESINMELLRKDSNDSIYSSANSNSNINILENHVKINEDRDAKINYDDDSYDHDEIEDYNNKEKL